MQVLVLVAHGSEEIEAVTVIDILRRAGVEVIVASIEQTLEITCSRHVKLIADESLSKLKDTINSDFEAIIVPGGLEAAKTFSSNQLVQEILKRFEKNHKLIAAMCASTTALHAAGIGKGKKATSYPIFKDKLETFYNYQETPVAIDENLITSRGPGTAMAWALAIVKQLLGSTKAKEVADQLLLMFTSV